MVYLSDPALGLDSGRRTEPVRVARHIRDVALDAQRQTQSELFRG